MISTIVLIWLFWSFFWPPFVEIILILSIVAMDTIQKADKLTLTLLVRGLCRSGGVYCAHIFSEKLSFFDFLKICHELLEVKKFQ